MSDKNKYLLPFILVTSLFFLWGIANSLNGILISHFQLALDLKRWQAGLVDSAFYLGYFVLAIPAGLFMNRFGFKKGILLGLTLYATGALLFYPAAEVRAYSFFPVRPLHHCIGACIFGNGSEPLRQHPRRAGKGGAAAQFFAVFQRVEHYIRTHDWQLAHLHRQQIHLG